jgi:signal recognition particle receptor subunit beta
MVLFNYSTKELTAKVVYYGPGLCGKTTNLQWIHEKLPIRNKGKMLSLATETDRTLFFDFLPIELGTIRGMKTRIQLYTVPGQVFYNATRRMVLKGADCVVFVCDSQEAMLDANLESLDNMRQNLEANEISPEDMPIVMQYNKRDLPNALPIEILNEKLNPRELPFYEAVAVRGVGVEETLKGVTGLVFRSLASKYGGAQAEAAAVAVPGAGKAPGVVTAPVPAPPPGSATISPTASSPALRIVPPPAPRPPEPAPAPSALPPLVVGAEEAEDELLDSFELQPSAEIDDLIEMDLSGAADDPIESMDLAAPMPEPPPPAAPPKGKEAGRITLVSGPKETDDLRQRISRPPVSAPEPPSALDDLDTDTDEEIEELSLDMDTAPNRHLAPPVIRVDTLPPGARASSTVAKPAPAPAPPPPAAQAPVPAPAAPAPLPAPPAARVAPPATIATPPVRVQVPATPGETDVSIPLEVKLDGGNTVTIHLRLTLNLHLQQ